MGSQLALSRLAVLPILFSATACIPAYRPPAAHAPLFTDEGEVRIAAQGGTNTIDVQIAVAPIENVGVLVATSITPDSFYNYYGEAGGGVFLPFGIGRFEAYGGFGGGAARGLEPVAGLTSSGLPTVSRCATDTNCTRSGTFIRPWAQATIGLTTAFFDLALVNRFSFFQIKWDPDTSGYDPTSDGFYYEPVAVIRVGYKVVKLEYQFGLTVNMGNTAGRSPPTLGFQTTAGISVAMDFWGEDEIHMVDRDFVEPREAEPEENGQLTGGDGPPTSVPEGEDAPLLEEAPVTDADVDAAVDSITDPVLEPDPATDPAADTASDTATAVEAIEDLKDLEAEAAGAGAGDIPPPEEPAVDEGAEPPPGDEPGAELPLPVEPPAEDPAVELPPPEPEAEADTGKKKKKKKKKKGKKKKGKKKKKKKKK